MAVTKGPLASLVATGNLGNGAIQFRTMNGRTHAYKPTPPSRQNKATASAKQAIQRDKFSRVCDEWKALSVNDRLIWKNISVALERDLSPWNAYLKYSLQDIDMSQNLIDYLKRQQLSTNTIKHKAGQNLSGNMAVIIYDGMALYADNSNINHAGIVIGITTGGASIGSDATIQYHGEMTEPSWNWITNEPIFLGTHGRLSQIDTSTAFSNILGFAVTPTTMFINLETPILRI